MAGLIRIVQPSNLITSVEGCIGKLTWKPTFAAEKNAAAQNAQKYIDSEVIRLSDPLTPKQTGNLINSGTTGTTLGSGEVRWIAVYAHYQYYNTSLSHSTSKNPQGGSKWFDRMKASNARSILEGAKKQFS